MFLSSGRTAEGEGERRQRGETEGVMDEEDGELKRAPQLLFFALAALGCEAVAEDNAACETEFGCLQGLLFAALASSDDDQVEGGSRERGRMGGRMRMVREARW
jgi:hypothetical protein